MLARCCLSRQTWPTVGMQRWMVRSGPALVAVEPQGRQRRGHGVEAKVELAAVDQQGILYVPGGRRSMYLAEGGLAAVSCADAHTARFVDTRSV